MNANLVLAVPQIDLGNSHPAGEVDELPLVQFIKCREYLEEGDFVQVDGETPCQVMLISDRQFENYKSGRAYDYFGGFIQFFPVNLAPPHAGFWNIVIDLGGKDAPSDHSISVVREG